MNQAYLDYLASPEWQEKRQTRLQLDGNRCRLCDEDGSRFHLEVHHRPASYASIPNESVDNDLITLCEYCHDTVTDIIRKNRQGYIPLASTVRDYSKTDVDGIGEYTHNSLDMAYSPDKESAVIVGVISELTISTTKNGKPMARIKLDDEHGSIDIVVFCRTLDESKEFLFIGNKIECYGEIQVFNGKHNVLANIIHDCSKHDSAINLRSIDDHVIAWRSTVFFRTRYMMMRDALKK